MRAFTFFERDLTHNNVVSGLIRLSKTSRRTRLAQDC